MLDELAALLDAVTILTPREMFFAGQPVDLGPPEWPVAFAPPLPPVLTGLHYRLYRNGYCRRVDDAPVPDPGSTPPDAGFAAALTAANPGQSRLDPGWEVVGPGPDGQTWLQKEGQGRAAWPGAFLASTTPYQALKSGHTVSLLWSQEDRALQPGIYFVFGAAVPDDIADARTVRFYWHIRAEGAARLLAALAGMLNRFQIPFRFKCLVHPAHYTRRDPAVLYVSRRDYSLVARLVQRVYAIIAPDLRPDTPLFTRRLAPGLSLAEDLGGRESFGQQRCRLLAEGLWHAYEAGTPAGTARLRAVCDHLAQAGVDLERPHLNAGTREDYPWPP